VDLFLLIFFPILAALLSLIFHLDAVPSALIFYGLPTLYLGWLKPEIIKKSVIFALVATIGISWAFGHMVYLDNIWWVKGVHLMRNTVTIEEIVWGFLWALYGVMFWEYFLDHDKNKSSFSPYFRYLIILLVVQMVIFFALYFMRSPWLVQPYFYLKFGVVMMASLLAIVAVKFPKLLKKLAILGVYFFFVSVLNEYIALYNSQWLFLGTHYLGSITMAHQVLPWDEIIFWWILGAPGIICWYELFADDRR
jgi:hypothetical protein